MEQHTLDASVATSTVPPGVPFEEAPDGIVMTDPQGRLVVANRRFCELTGLSLDELRGTAFADLVQAGEPGGVPFRPDQLDIGLTVLRAGRLARRDGGMLEAEVSMRKLTDGSAVAVVRDVAGRRQQEAVLAAETAHADAIGNVAERQRAEAELRRNEQEYRSLYQQFRGILDAIPDAMCLISHDLRIIWANEVAAANMGMTMPQFLGKHCYESRHGLAEPCKECIVLQSFASGVPVAGEGTTLDGRVWELHALPVMGDDGSVTGVIEAARDITERKQDEAERTNLQAQLAQAQKMESVGRLAGGVAHDFNNMLTIILSHAELALDRVLPDQPLFGELQAIRKAAERSADLTRQLLAFARKQTVAPKVLDLNEVVEGMLKMLRRLIGEDIDLAWLPGGGLWPVKVDPSQVDQILANLCVNARDAIGDTGKVTIETGKVTLDEAYCSGHVGFIPGDFVVLAVSDDGCGMDAGTLARLFEPFFTTKEQGKGTGLGLATVYGIVKQNRGFINVYSEPGRGSTFRIYLPRYSAEPDAVPKSEAVRPALRGRGTILVVEDEPAILSVVKVMLERQGYQVLAASSPDEAIRLGAAHGGEIRLLLTDVVMPGMNGRDLAGRLRAFHPGLESLFMSGYTANVIAHHGVLDEGVHFISKPFSSVDLLAKVEEVLRGRT